MTDYYELDPPKEGAEPQLPPLFSSQKVLEGKNPFDKAVASASSGDVGTVFYSSNKDLLNIAITLGPEVSRIKAIQIHYAMMLGLSDALGALAPPEIEISHLWPNLMFMNRGLMGKVLLIEPGGDQDSVPSWMVSGVKIRMKVDTVKFDKDLEATSLEDEGASFLSSVRIIEAVTRHFLVWLNTWQDEGFKPIHKTWMERVLEKISLPTLPNGKPGNWVALDENGLGLFKHKNKHFSLSLEDAKINS